jgi:hypothetical protein
MAAKRKRGRPVGSSKGPRLKRGKLSSKRAVSYLNRGLARELKKKGRKRGTTSKARKGGHRRGRKAGFKHSAATKAKISKGLKSAWKRGSFKSRRKRSGGRKRAA